MGETVFARGTTRLGRWLRDQPAPGCDVCIPFPVAPLSRTPRVCRTSRRWWRGSQAHQHLSSPVDMLGGSAGREPAHPDHARRPWPPSRSSRRTPAALVPCWRVRGRDHGAPARRVRIVSTASRRSMAPVLTSHFSPLRADQRPISRQRRGWKQRLADTRGDGRAACAAIHAVDDDAILLENGPLRPHGPARDWSTPLAAHGHYHSSGNRHS